MVLEAADRVGGRTYTAKVLLCTDYSSCVRMAISQAQDGKKWVDLGAGYVGPTQDHLLKFAQRYNVKSYHVYTAGKTALGLNVRAPRLPLMIRAP